ncbi:MAG: cation transporter [Lachnospiraceae bacterium]|nr:cation transporter [Lachnospiraceae bacterium]MCD8217007.1 cation transporter [Clostridiales bacterium]
MNKITLTIDGMACGMCETHVCDAIRKAVDKGAKVSASHTKGTAEIILDDSPDVARIRSAVNQTGYKVTDVKVEPYEKKRRLFGK